MRKLKKSVLLSCLPVKDSTNTFTEETIQSDYKPLEAIFKKPLLSTPKRLQHMLLRLQKYNIDVICKKGRDLHIADFLSRAALPNIQITAVTPQHEIFKI